MIDFDSYLRGCADGHTIYVLGGQGEILSDMTEEERHRFISVREHSNMTYITQDKAAYQLKVTQGFEKIAAFDCSGLIVHFLLDITGEIGYDTTANGLYKMCDYHPSLNELKPYDLVFMGNNPNDIWHCGVYIGDGKVIESRRIGYGVQMTDFDKRGWNMFGHLKQLDKYLPPENHPNFTITKPMQQGATVKKLQQLLNDCGFNCGNVDGKFGKKTNAALQKFCRYYLIEE